MDFKKDLENYRKAIATAKKSAIEFLTNLCNDNNGRVEIDVDYDGFLCVTYDGGRHPEYDTNAFSQVYGIYIKEGKLYLEIEESDEYSIDRVSASEIIDLAEGLS